MSVTAHLSTQRGPTGCASMQPVPKPGTVERRDHPVARELARILRNYRRRKGLGIEEFAVLSGIPERDVRRYERGTYAPDIPGLLMLAPFYDVPAWKIVKRMQGFVLRLEKEKTDAARAVS